MNQNHDDNHNMIKKIKKNLKKKKKNLKDDLRDLENGAEIL